MRLKELRKRVSQPIFSTYQVEKLFPDEPKNQINVQLSRMAIRGDLLSLKKGIYIFDGETVDEMLVANLLYRPSYVSLETALNLYGMMVDVPVNVTSVSPITSKEITTDLGAFLYSRISRELFFGFFKQESSHPGIFYNLAFAEKALLDYVYIRKVKDLRENRIEVADLDKNRLKLLMKAYPNWVKRIVL